MQYCIYFLLYLGKKSVLLEIKSCYCTHIDSSKQKPYITDHEVNT